MGNPFVHIELNSTDVGKAKEFYTQLFDWKFVDMPMPGGPADAVYAGIDESGGTGGGMLQQMIPGAPSSWLAYAAVADIQGATDKARKLGATVMRDVSEVPGMGWLSIIRDPTGATLGLWQPKAT